MLQAGCACPRVEWTQLQSTLEPHWLFLQLFSSQNEKFTLSLKHRLIILVCIMYHSMQSFHTRSRHVSSLSEFMGYSFVLLCNYFTWRPDMQIWIRQCQAIARWLSNNLGDGGGVVCHHPSIMQHKRVDLRQGILSTPSHRHPFANLIYHHPRDCDSVGVPVFGKYSQWNWSRLQWLRPRFKRD